VSRRVAVLLCCAVAAIVAGCGEPAADTTSGSLVLTVYTTGQLQGDDAQDARDGADAAKLALRQAEGMAGEFTVNLVTLDDTDPETGRWGKEQAVANARRAIADRNIIAYIGDTSSEATALTLPLLNEAGVLQIGPQSGYVGLTRPAGRGEPERFYPAGERTFGRIAPADDLGADALLEAMEGAGARRLAVLDDGELEAIGTAALITARAQSAGIEVVDERSVDTGDEDQSGLARDVVESGADAVLYAGSRTDAAATVLDALHAADPALALFGPAGLAEESFARAVGAGTARRVTLASPVVPLGELPAGAARFARAFADEFGREPAPRAVFTYEAMRAILAAVRAAGVKGNDRSAVTDAWFALRDRDGALGTWSVIRSGDTTIRRYGLWRVRDGRLSFVREARTRR
jgi:branched-chain amino acid transport system substrate-binding protein